MYFTAYILQTGLYLGSRSDVKEVMLYNGRRVFIFGKSGDSKGTFNPGDLIEFHCGHNGADTVDMERDQPQGEYYKLSHDWACRVTNEDTIKTFFLGARILNIPGRMTSKIKNYTRTLISWFRKLQT